MESQTARNPHLLILAVVAIILIIPAFFINLGITPVIEDEATRGLVSLEMDYSGHYFTPTVGGSFYYNKPPLFNWIVLTFFKAGGYNELMIRLPVVISLLLFGLTIFLVVRKQLGDKIALTTALIFVTCGRILIYESLKGLIDIIFSWVLFCNFILLYEGIKKQKYFLAFLFSYILMAIAFLLKGLPAIAFQALTIIVLLSYWKKWKGLKVLFFPAHLAGVLAFLALIASYYLIYFHHNSGSYKELFSVLLEQNTRRTVLKYGILSTIGHLFTYPFETIGHFLPWTLLVIYFFKKGVRKLLAGDFIICSLLVFFVNIIPYWTSPESFPRYILMLIPLLFLVLVHLYEEDVVQNSIFTKVLYRLFLGCFVLFLLVCCSIPFLSATAGRHFIVLKTFFLLVSIGTILYFYVKHPQYMLIYTALFLLVVRIGFNWFVLTHRVDHMADAISRNQAKEIGAFVEHKNVYVYGEPYRDWDESKPKYLDFFYRYYISTQAHKIIRNSDKPDTSSYFIVDPYYLKNKCFKTYMVLSIPGEEKPRLLVGRFTSL
jgi:hypothetical protein